MKKEKVYQIYDGFKFLEKCEKIKQLSELNLSKPKILKIKEYSELAIQLLIDYPYHLAKAYRNLGEMNEMEGNIEGAIENYTLALKHNPKVGVKKKLAKLDPGNPASITQAKRPPFEITFLISNSLRYINTHKSVPAGQAPRGTYYKTMYLDDFCVYTKNHYDNNSFLENISPQGETTVSFTTSSGKFINNIRFDHLIYYISIGTNLAPIATISFDQQLRFFKSIGKDPVIQYIPTFSKQRYEISGLFVDDDGSNIYYSSGETLYMLDNKLNLKKKLTFSPEQQKNGLSRNNFIVRRSPKYQHAISILHLSENPTNDQIKLAYRNRLLEVHPDINQNNPNANNETRAVIEAYELLTKNEFMEENLSFHEIIFSRFIFYMPAFEDSITSFCVSNISKEIYIGYRSGRVLKVNKANEKKLIFNSSSPVREIIEVTDYIFLISNNLTILKNLEFFKRIEEPIGKIRIFPKDHLIIILLGGLVKLYTIDGDKFGEISFRDNIADIYSNNFNMLVYTAKTIYEFNIDIKSNNLLLV